MKRIVSTTKGKITLPQQKLQFLWIEAISTPTNSIPLVARLLRCYVIVMDMQNRVWLLLVCDGEKGKERKGKERKGKERERERESKENSDTGEKRIRRERGKSYL